MMKTILVATDFSTPARNAVDYAASLAKAAGAELLLFNVYKMSIHASNARASTASMNKLIKKNEDRLIKRAKETEEQFGIKVRWEMRRDNTIASLKKHMKDHAIDLVVMGIESNLKEYKMFGNTTTSVVRLMQFPMLVVPHNIQYHGIHKIMYACESSYLKDDNELDLLKQFVKDFDAQLEVFHVLKNNPKQVRNEALENVMDRILHDIDHSFRYVNSPKVGDGIKAGLEESPADLLVMVPHKPGFIESLTKKSNTNRMTVETRIPLLVIPNDID
jgi:nucleotide-binding universal stress UspA family protein